MIPTISKRHVFRYRLSDNTANTKFSADDLLNIIAVWNGSSGALVTGVITSYRLRKVTLYTAANESTDSFTEGPYLLWSNGSGALTEEGKAQTKSTLISNKDVASRSVLIPPAKSNQGFWFNDTAAGDVFDVVVPSALSCVLDIEMDITFADVLNEGRPIITVTVPTRAGFCQRSKLNWAPVGYEAYSV